MKKRLLCLSLALIMIFSLLPLSAFAEEPLEIWGSGECGENATWTVYYDSDYNGTLIISGFGPMYEYESANYVPWRYAIDYQTVIIESGITSICDSAFYDCDSLTDITIPNGVRSIGAYAFKNCDNLTNVSIGDSVLSIGWEAFRGCKSMTNVDMPSSIEEIGDSAFYDCDSMTVVSIPRSGVDIGSSAFSDCDSLREVIIPKLGENTGDYLFSNCDSLTKATLFGEMTRIEKGMFYDCDSLTSITIPSFVTHIEDYAFYSCDSLKSVYISENVENIGYKAFSDCTSLREIYIPASVTTIWEEGEQFSYCSSLININVSEDNTRYSSVDGILYSKDSSVLIACPGGREEVVIPDGVEYIRDFAFCYCDRLKDVYYGGSEEQWNEITIYDGNDCLQSANIHFSDSPDLAITKQPANLYAKDGTTGYISVTATGDGLTYQWQYQKTGSSTWTNSTAASAKSAKFAVSARTAIDGYKYRCVVKDSGGKSIPSDVVSLKVFAITKQPANISAKDGTVAKLSVTATGNGLTYQWQYQKPNTTSWVNSTSSSGKTATFSVNAREAIDGYKYRCIVKDSEDNSITSSTATLTVTSGLAITKQPSNLTAKSGTTGYISITATGNGLTYQWQYQKPNTTTWVNSTATSGTTTKFAVSAREAINGYKYRCIVKDSSGKSVTSNTVTLTVTSALAITKQPANLYAKGGTTGYISVTATGTGLTYQWQYQKTGTTTWTNSTATSAKSAKFAVSARETINGYKYRCIIKDANGNSVTTNTVTLSVFAITKQPTNLTAAGGTTGKLSVTAIGKSLTYQWQYQKTGTTTWVNSTATSGTTATFSVSARAAIDGYKYRCIVKDSAGNSITSNVVTLTVK